MDTVRTQFEAAFANDYEHIDGAFTRDNVGGYRKPSVHQLWVGYQAGQASNAQEIARLGRELAHAQMAAAAHAKVADECRKDAQRWRAFIGSARIRMIGSAGLKSDKDYYGNPYNNYAHLGMEIWTKYGNSLSPVQTKEMEAGNAMGRDWLIKYADIAIAAQQSSDAAISKEPQA